MTDGSKAVKVEALLTKDCLLELRPKELRSERPLFTHLPRETVLKLDLSNAPAVNLAGIRTTQWAEKSLLSAVRRATLQTSPRLFGQFLERLSDRQLEASLDPGS